MTVTRNQRNLSETSETLPPSTTLSRKAHLLKTSQQIFSKDLASEEVEFWKKFLEPFGLAETEYAFDSWNRNGKWFPKPAEIKELIDAHREANRPVFRLSAPVPGSLAGSEWMVLWHMVLERKKKFEEEGKTYIPLTNDEIDGLIREVKAKSAA